MIAFAAFIGAMCALWQLLAADDALAGLRWGIGAVLLFQLTLLLRGYMGSQLQANRVLRELSRLELRLVRLERRATGDTGDTGDPGEHGTGKQP